MRSYYNLFGNDYHVRPKPKPQTLMAEHHISGHGITSALP